jgi:hypothetical protein
MTAGTGPNLLTRPPKMTLCENVTTEDADSMTMPRQMWPERATFQDYFVDCTRQHASCSVTTKGRGQEEYGRGVQP